jgi:hypothetical protein
LFDQDHLRFKPNAEAVFAQFEYVVDMLEPKSPAVAEMAD